MDFETILADSGRRTIDLVIRAVGNDPVLFHELLELALADRGKLSARAAWAIYLCQEQYGHDLRSYQGRIIRKIQDTRSGALRKNLLRRKINGSGKLIPG